MAEDTYNVIGLMSGTSLDGTDVAHCRFTFADGKWKYRIIEAQTFPYDHEWKNRLSGLMYASAMELARVHAEYGHYLGNLVKQFMQQHNLEAMLVSSHGHTVFHNPKQGFTCQIGDGAALASECGLPVVCDLRSMDVAFGGQGAPLVPGGEALLFPQYHSLLNLGGFANISIRESGQSIAFDICPCNIVLNYLSQQVEMEYDEGGAVSRSGNLIPGLLRELNNLDFYREAPPKSLGREWVEKEIFPLLNSVDSLPDLLRTVTEHIAVQVSGAIPAGSNEVLITGGGAFNGFLVERIRMLSPAPVVIPNAALVSFKEALVFAFLGLLRFLQQPNCLASVTGARTNVCGGAIYIP